MRLLVPALLLASLSSGCLGGLFEANGISPYDYLKDSKYETWVIEVDSVSGQAPSSATLSFLEGRIGPHVDKPGGIDFVTGGSVPGGGSPWTKEDVLDLTSKHKDRSTGDGTVVLHLLFLDGQYEREDVLGVTIGYGTIAIFRDVIDSACQPLTLCFNAQEDILRAVLVHEFGHALGLVNRGIPMVNDHEDPDSPGHSDNSASVMWSAIESAGSVGSLNTIPTQFDSDDSADMRAARD